VIALFNQLGDSPASALLIKPMSFRS